MISGKNASMVRERIMSDTFLVAVIGFSINFAAYSSEMMRTGIETVDKGQSEAALARTPPWYVSV